MNTFNITSYLFQKCVFVDTQLTVSNGQTARLSNVCLCKPYCSSTFTYKYERLSYCLGGLVD